MTRLRPRIGAAFGWALPLALATALGACGNSPSAPAPIPSPVHRFETLSSRLAVLRNLELAYNMRRLDRVDQLLDQHYVFFLSDFDVSYGYPVQWARNFEVEYTGKLLDPHNGLYNFSEITFDLHLDDHPPVWEAITSDSLGADSLSGETWYRTGVNYSFTFTMDSGFVYTNPGAPAIFVVRNSGTTAAPRWRLVQCRDLENGCNFAVANGGGSPASIHPCPVHSWGAVKALYWLACAPTCARP
jgi:hypothetical protein